MTFSTESAHVSLQGLSHTVNQDAVLVQAPYFYGVADGVGGAAFGEIASTAALRHCASLTGPDTADPEALCAHVREGDEVVRQCLAEHGDASGATTLAAAWLSLGGDGWIVHVGDARACVLRFRWGLARLQRLTQDQTYGYLGEKPPRGVSPDNPARMLGNGAVGNPPATSFHLSGRDILLLCSDGLHHYAKAREIERIAEAWLRRRKPLQGLAEDLAQLALAGGSRDDISLVLVRRAVRGACWFTPMLNAVLARLRR